MYLKRITRYLYAVYNDLIKNMKFGILINIYMHILHVKMMMVMNISMYIICVLS